MGKLPGGQWLYVGRVNRDSHTGLISLDVGHDGDHFQVTEGAEYITFITPAPLFPDEKES